MPTADEYRQKIRRLKHRDLIKLWAQIHSGVTPGWDPGKAFEYLIIRAFELEGASVAWPYSVKLHGHDVEQIDGAIHFEDFHFLVESKDLGSAVAIAPIAKLRNQLMRRPPGTFGVLFGRSGFTEAARTLATYMVPVQVLLWEGIEVERCLGYYGMSRGLRQKYMHAVEHGLPDHVIR